jgi:hypothetical protein
MKKDLFTSYKPWLLFTAVVFSLVLITFGSVNAAKPDLSSSEFDPWTSNGFKDVTVRLPSELGEIAAAPQADCNLNTSGLISHWPLDDQAGATTFLDVVGSMHGTCAGDKCPTRSFGIIGTAFNFVALDKDVISVAADVEPGKTKYDTMANGTFSAGVWVRTVQTCEVPAPDNLKNKVFVGRYRNDNINGTWWLGCTEPGGVAVFRLRDSSNIPRQINGTTRINDGRWHYIVGVRDAAADENYLYVDGQFEGMLDLPLYTGNFSSDMPITMGAYDEETNYYMDGILDEIVLYNRVLPPDEISTHYENCKTTVTANYLPMIVH